MTHIENAHPRWKEELESEISPVAVAVAVLGDSESDTAVPVLDKNDEKERRLRVDKLYNRTEIEKVK